MPHGNFSRLNDSHRPVVEALEGRRLLSGSIAASVSSDHTASPALVVAPAVLTSRQVIGTYRGSVVIKGIKGSLAARLVITPTYAKLTIAVEGTLSVQLSAQKFKELRDGNLTLSAVFGPTTRTFAGTFSQNGKLISGTLTTTGGPPLNGTFSLTKR